MMVSSLCGLQCEEEGEREAEEQGEEEKEKIFQKLPSDVQKDVLQKCASMWMCIYMGNIGYVTSLCYSTVEALL